MSELVQSVPTIKAPQGLKDGTVTVDGNEAVAQVAYKVNELIAIYPITPSSPMAEFADNWAAHGEKNIWGTIPLVQEMESEGGVAGALHGALLTGSLATTFTSSQGLLLLIPNMFKMAGELTSVCIYVTARSVATHALSIFCDHSDVMATRSTGWAMLFANSVQEAHDFALIGQAATLKARVPFMHVIDGFRTSHEVNTIEQLSDEDISKLLDHDAIKEHRFRALSPDHPVVRGTAQNPDVFFQSREGCNQYYQEAPIIVADIMDKFACMTGRRYQLFDYVGAPDATNVIVAMGSGAETIEQVVIRLLENGEKVGLLKVRLFRPFSCTKFLQSLPESVNKIAVLDRTKEPGAPGEPLFQDVITAVAESERAIKVVGGRYGLGSKEFTPSMVKAVFAELAKSKPKRGFTVGIVDDITNLSLPVDNSFVFEPPDSVRAVFWGLGSDGTIGANKNSIKIIGEATANFAQGYFVYDSKKSGSVTVSHLRFGPEKIHAPYLIEQANFVAVHQYKFLERLPVLSLAAPEASVLINSPYGAETWHHLPGVVQQEIKDKKLRVYALDADNLAKELGLAGRINTIMQAGFFALADVMPLAEAILRIKESIRKSYLKFGEPLVRRNFAAVDRAIDHLVEIVQGEIKAEDCDADSCKPTVDSARQNSTIQPCCVSVERTLNCKGACRTEIRLDGNTCSTSRERSTPAGPEEMHGACGAALAHQTTMELIAGRGDLLPVSALPADGTFPTATSKFEKRDISCEIPVWDPSACVQCGKCVLVCPHAVIRAKIAPSDCFVQAPATLKTMPASWPELREQLYTLQVSTEDCTGCRLCVEACPVESKSQSGRKAINMEARDSLSNDGNWNYFLELPDIPEPVTKFSSVKNVQLLPPLFEFSGACAGCGETPYLKLLSQLFGERAIIANATGCSSIYGGSLPTTPWTTNRTGKGPAWANSLFEDNAEFGLGMRLSVDLQERRARELLNELKEQIGYELCNEIEQTSCSQVHEVQARRQQISKLQAKLIELEDEKARELLTLINVLVPRSIWLVGGDGWAYDIGYGGVDHVLASGKNVNILVLDTEVYSNTGGQMSKATSLGAVAKFAAGGKGTAKKDLGRLAMTYGEVYVARIAMGANDSQSIKAFIEAESFNGPSLIIAYCHCIAHGIDMSKGMSQQMLAVRSGHWPLYRFDPRFAHAKKNPFQLDCPPPSVPLEDYYYSEARYRMLKESDPASAAALLILAKEDVAAQWKELQRLASPNP